MATMVLKGVDEQDTSDDYAKATENIFLNYVNGSCVRIGVCVRACVRACVCICVGE
ncbi:hypothetical protein BIW11_09151 [Tropilaelaps mercedesae]|uniref:Uncharacterized protein n=1 Tax=Tropilaelaps mercedesae TaxID=418985 RepID=A0A1V9XLS6_9ACAR|nr:hypothetical protein BIW11_09151 [Tropilaelaps mercedesae]